MRVVYTTVRVRLSDVLFPVILIWITASICAGSTKCPGSFTSNLLWNTISQEVAFHAVLGSADYYCQANNNCRQYAWLIGDSNLLPISEDTWNYYL